MINPYQPPHYDSLPLKWVRYPMNPWTQAGQGERDRKYRRTIGLLGTPRTPPVFWGVLQGVSKLEIWIISCVELECDALRCHP